MGTVAVAVHPFVPEPKAFSKGLPNLADALGPDCTYYVRGGNGGEVYPVVTTGLSGPEVQTVMERCAPGVGRFREPNSFAAAAGIKLATTCGKELSIDNNDGRYPGMVDFAMRHNLPVFQRIEAAAGSFGFLVFYQRGRLGFGKELRRLVSRVETKLGRPAGDLRLALKDKAPWDNMPEAYRSLARVVAEKGGRFILQDGRIQPSKNITFDAYVVGVDLRDSSGMGRELKEDTVNVNHRVLAAWDELAQKFGLILISLRGDQGIFCKVVGNPKDANECADANRTCADFVAKIKDLHWPGSLGIGPRYADALIRRWPPHAAISEGLGPIVVCRDLLPDGSPHICGSGIDEVGRLLTAHKSTSLT